MALGRSLGNPKTESQPFRIESQSLRQIPSKAVHLGSTPMNIFGRCSLNIKNPYEVESQARPWLK